MNTVKKILWPIDPRGSHKDMDHAMFHFFESFAKVENYEIQPVHVLSSAFFVTSEYFEAVDFGELQKNIYSECEDYLQYFKDYVKKEPLILNHHYSASGAEVSLFNDFVKDYKPDFVVMSSHGRKGWARGFLGSFTESFLLASEAPVIVVGSQCQKSFNMKKGLMPIEVNKESRDFVESILGDSRLSFLDDMILFHKISMIDLEGISWAPTMYGLADFTSDDIVTKAKETSHRFLNELSHLPSTHTKVQVQVSESLAPVVDEIKKEMEEKDYGVLVMRSTSNHFSTYFLGSITREIIRDSQLPVVVFPHKYK